MAGFLIRFLVVYLFLMIPWPGSGDAYRWLFVRAGSVVYKALGSSFGVSLEAKETDGPADTALNVRHRATNQVMVMGINSREIGYLATAVITSLILATPSGWRRRGRSLLVGLLLVNVFVAIRPLVLILYWANRELPISPDPSLWEKTVSAAVQFVGVGQPLSYIVPILIWMLVSLRRDDLAKMLSLKVMRLKVEGRAVHDENPNRDRKGGVL